MDIVFILGFVVMFSASILFEETEQNPNKEEIDLDNKDKQG